ncbi:Flagellar biosynthetic protein FliQ [Planctomycetes bacterium Pla163]|uniref:Flagellar biosynthetic protein FliQ n=1 Tax=Rohdeia mirabilis TaxID=2528008 RepID=A0A518D4T0_9BACT|nr:Flagellar biosynthetic protein FliQ [Planctomycetes bacterium Pla163]
MDTLDLRILDLAREMMVTVIILAGPILVGGLIVGLIVSLFQALTSIQEQTLSLVPKMFAVIGMTLMVLAPGLALLGDYTVKLIQQMTTFGLS